VANWIREFTPDGAKLYRELLRNHGDKGGHQPAYAPG